MSGRRPTGRFFILIILLGVTAYFAVTRFTSSSQQYALVVSGSASYARAVQAVIVRDEQIGSMDSNSTLVYAAGEGDLLAAGDEIAYVYSAGYSAKEMSKLESIRQDIRAYHADILKNIVDAELERLDENVTDIALQLKALVNGRAEGSLTSIEKQLNAAMTARQDYLRSNRREDTKLNVLYDEENKREVAISSWRSVETAAASGVVSFYLDGHESYYTPANMEAISVADVKSLLAGKTSSDAASRLTTNIYRLVGTGDWYALLLVSDSSFNPATGQRYWFQLEGFEDVVYSSSVMFTQKSGSDVLVALSVSDPIGPLVNARCGAATISTELTGLYVPSRALVTVNGQQGVRVYDGGEGLFVPVNVVSRDSNGVLVTPLVEGSLLEGNYVLV